MAKLSEEIKQIIADIHPGIVATVSKSGKPNVSVKGSFQVLDDEHVMFADVHSPQTIANLKENPQVAVIVLDPASRKGCRIWGKAEILTSGPEVDKVNQAMAARNVKANGVVKIAVEEAKIY